MQINTKHGKEIINISSNYLRNFNHKSGFCADVCSIGEVMSSKELKIKNIDVGVAPSAIAQDIFYKAVSPVMGILKQEGSDSVKEFSFCVMWLAMGLYVNNLSTKDAEKALNHATANMIIQLKKLRGEV